jgi:NAD(P)H-dependent flavin oxidoreductase YrpB (nitropropane dioxygenase family)
LRNFNKNPLYFLSTIYEFNTKYEEKIMIETDITKMIGIKHPIFLAPMGPFYTTKSTIAISEAGGCGCLSHTNLLGKNSFDEMKNNMLEVIEATDKPFGFNIRTARMQPDAKNLCRQIPKFIMSNPKLRDQVRYALTSAGTARMLLESKTFQKLKANTEIKNFHVAPAKWLAHKCVTAGMDGLVVTGTEGGGHQAYEKVGLLSLIQEIRADLPDTPIIACGSIANGYGLAGALAAGAGAVAMGSRFIASEESEFHPNYKAIVAPSRSWDTTLVTGFLAPIRLWKNKYTAHHGLVTNKEAKIAEEDAMTLEQLIADQKHYEQIYHGHMDDGAVPLGQSCGAISKIEKTKDIIETMVADAEKLLKNASSYIK